MGSLLDIGKIASSSSGTEVADGLVDNIPLINLVPGITDQAHGLVKDNASWINSIFSTLIGFWHTIEDVIVGFINPHIKEVKTQTIANIDAQTSKFQNLTNTLGLDATVAEQLKTDVKEAMPFGLGALFNSNGDSVDASYDLQLKLQEHIANALKLKYGTAIAGNVDRIAQDAAASITGLKLDALRQSNEADIKTYLHSATSDQHDGFNQLLTDVKSNLKSGGAVPDLKFDPASNQALLADWKAVTSPAPASQAK